MTTQRKLNSAYEGIARAGAPKNIPAAPVAHGMKRTTQGELAAYHHGVSVDDTPNTVKSFEAGAAPTHPGMVTDPKSNSGDAYRGKHDPKFASMVLNEAANLGRGEKA